MSSATSAHPSGPRRVVVVGAGLAGARACQELRARGYDGDLVLLGAEQHPPYDRPPLSKAVLSGGVDDTTLDLPLEARFVPGGRATALPADGVLATSAGDLPWDGLVLACGARPRRLPDDHGTLCLRTIEDARELRSQVVPGARVVVIGAGWIGAEVAGAAAGRGAEVTVLEAAPAPLSASVGPEVGAATMPWYARAGVELRTGVRVAAAGPDGVRLADGTQLRADVVLSALGVRPDVDWLAGSGLPIGRGVRVDAGLQAAPRVVAVGDCAERWSPRAGSWVGMEHWDDALHSPEVAAATLLGAPGVYDPVPYVWSEQFGHYLQFVGRVGPRSLWRGDPQDPEGWALAWLAADGRLVGFLGVDRPREVRQARKVIAADRVPDPERLADPGRAVRDC